MIGNAMQVMQVAMGEAEEEYEDDGKELDAAGFQRGSDGVEGSGTDGENRRT